MYFQVFAARGDFKAAGPGAAPLSGWKPGEDELK
jgi:hypothetical protein